MATDRLLEKEHSSMDSSTSDLGLEVPRTKRHWADPTRLRVSFFIHLTLIAIYTLAFSLTVDHISKKYQHGPDLIYSPAREVVRYEKKYINNDVNATNPYKGPPRPELDDAWHDLFIYNNIRLTAEELKKMNRTSIQLADGSGDYLAAVDVYHHLHCVKMIRQYLHPEYYNMPESLMVDKAEHVDHCLDALRQELMCRAEVTFTTYEWLPDLPIPWAQLSYDHACVNFDAIHAWAATRAIDIFDPKYLSHPTKGFPFKHDSSKPDHEGTVYSHD
ncbi:MAG: hypothetical protein MMC33_008909 [Icmadophila ericetorum]|nr:hypothetical protein [Icmadophila ericetorum]